MSDLEMMVKILSAYKKEEISELNLREYFTVALYKIGETSPFRILSRATSAINVLKQFLILKTLPKNKWNKTDQYKIDDKKLSELLKTFES